MLHTIINSEIENNFQSSNTSYPDDGNVPDHPSREVQLQPARGVAKMEQPIRKILAGVGSNGEETSQINTLIYAMGDKADNILTSLKLTEAQKRKYDVVRQKLEQCFVKRRNPIFEWAKFSQRKQEEDEPADSFILALYCLAEYCGYGELHDETNWWWAYVMLVCQAPNGCRPHPRQGHNCSSSKRGHQETAGSGQRSREPGYKCRQHP